MAIMTDREEYDLRCEAAERAGWSGILIFGEISGEGLHPVVYELVGKAIDLSGKIKGKISVVLIGAELGRPAMELLSYGVDNIFAYEHESFRYFKADNFAACFTDSIDRIHPSIVLAGATFIGRSLAPRVSTRFRSGLTADCTGLDITEEGDLLQVRSVLGGSIITETITPYGRPQFATVRYKVFDKAKTVEPHGEIISVPVTESLTKSGIELISVEQKHSSKNISEAEVLVVGGKGLRSKEDLELIKALAKKLNGQYAVTRPLVEAGWAPQSRQIGLSGRKVKPKLLLAFGVSGAVQFTEAMKNSECIFAVNSDANAPIMKIANYSVVGDLYEILQNLLEV